MTNYDNAHTRKIAGAINQIISYLREASVDEFARGKMLQDAILRQLEIASKASRTLSVHFGQKYQGIPCHQFLGMEDGVAVIATNKDEMADAPQSLTDLEREHIKKTLKYTGGNRTRAALILGISRVSLLAKIRSYKLA